MKPVIIGGTSQTPEINFNHQTGVLIIKGKSFPENPLEFYRPILEWLDNYSQNPQKLTQMNIHFEYLNTSSSKWLYDLFKILKIIIVKGNQVVVNWYYDEDDEDMMETGEDFQDVIDLPINIIGVGD
jgi:hypothetical protein